MAWTSALTHLYRQYLSVAARTYLHRFELRQMRCQRLRLQQQRTCCAWLNVYARVRRPVLSEIHPKSKFLHKGLLSLQFQFGGENIYEHIPGPSGTEQVTSK